MNNPADKRRSRAGWWFVAACVLHFAVWTAWFVIAGKHPVAEVPLADRVVR